MIYELREYLAKEHTTDRLHDRFQKVTIPLFERHGLDLLGFWVDAADDRRFVYLLRFEDDAEQRRCWQAFQQDPDWNDAKQASEIDGPIVAGMTSHTLLEVPYWPSSNTGGTR